MVKMYGKPDFLAWNLKKWKYQINLVTICFENKQHFALL